MNAAITLSQHHARGIHVGGAHGQGRAQAAGRSTNTPQPR
jgi:hypothetical protein